MTKHFLFFILAVVVVGCSQPAPVEIPEPADLQTRATANPAINPNNTNWEGTTAGK